MAGIGTDTTAYGQSWYAATMVDVPQRPPLAFDIDVDVCVIGGGLAGLTTAREVARHGWSVALLEADRLAAGASGRNTGFVLPGFAAEPDSLIARVGFERTKDLWALSQAGLDYVRMTAQSGAMTSIDLQDGWLYVSKVDDGDEFLHSVAQLGELGCEIEGWPTERVRSVLRSERYFNAVHYLRAFTIHPLNYALALAAAAEGDGARIFEGTPALSIDPAGVRKRIVTPRARLRAAHVVLCGNVQIGALMPQLASTLVPITTYVITTAPLGARLAQVVGYRGAVSDTDLADNHYRIVGDDRLMWLGRSTAWRAIHVATRGCSRPTSRRLIPNLVTSPSITPGQAHWAIRSTVCRRSVSSGPASGLPAASAATASTPQRWPETLSLAPSLRAMKPGSGSIRSSWCGRAELAAGLHPRYASGSSACAMRSRSAARMRELGTSLRCLTPLARLGPGMPKERRPKQWGFVPKLPSQGPAN